MPIMRKESGSVVKWFLKFIPLNGIAFMFRPLYWGYLWVDGTLRDIWVLISVHSTKASTKTSLSTKNRWNPLIKIKTYLKNSCKRRNFDCKAFCELGQWVNQEWSTNCGGIYWKYGRVKNTRIFARINCNMTFTYEGIFISMSCVF